MPHFYSPSSPLWGMETSEFKLISDKDPEKHTHSSDCTKLDTSTGAAKQKLKPPL